MSVFFHTIYGGPSDHFFAYYWGPQIIFFAYYMGPLRSLFLNTHTVWGPLSDQFRCLLYGAILRSVFLHAIGRGGGTSDFSFFTKYMGAPSDQFLSFPIWGPLRLVSLLTIWGPLRSVSVHTFWGPLSDEFFLLL